MRTNPIAVFRARFGSAAEPRKSSNRPATSSAGIRDSMRRGELVELMPEVEPHPDGELTEAAARSWHESSYELLHGAQICDAAEVHDGKLFTDWFGSRNDAPGTPDAAPQAGAIPDAR
jgi:hypothetical protein